MNLILFEAAEVDAPLPRRDPRAVHVLEVLRRREGEPFDVGLVNGARGKARILRVAEAFLELAFVWDALPPPSLDPLILVIGLPRPQTARKILQETTALGVAAVHFVRTEKGDANYAQSTLWSSGEWRRHLLTGAEQAFTTRLPEVTWGEPLDAVLALLTTNTGPAQSGYERLALDVYEAASALSAVAPARPTPASATPGAILAFGPERGWGPGDRAHLRAHGFTLAHLGPRVLRSETAVVAAVALLKARLGTF